jgi:tetratricopeptide (TPR) repeat protein
MSNNNTAVPPKADTPALTLDCRVHRHFCNLHDGQVNLQAAAEAQSLETKAEAKAEETNEFSGLESTLAHLGWTYLEAGSIEAAARCFLRSIELGRSAQPVVPEFELVPLLSELMGRSLGDPGGAAELLERTFQDTLRSCESAKACSKDDWDSLVASWLRVTGDVESTLSWAARGPSPLDWTTEGFDTLSNEAWGVRDWIRRACPVASPDGLLVPSRYEGVLHMARAKELATSGEDWHAIGDAYETLGELLWALDSLERAVQLGHEEAIASFLSIAEKAHFEISPQITRQVLERLERVLKEDTLTEPHQAWSALSAGWSELLSDTEAAGRCDPRSHSLQGTVAPSSGPDERAFLSDVQDITSRNPTKVLAAARRIIGMGQHRERIRPFVRHFVPILWKLRGLRLGANYLPSPGPTEAALIPPGERTFVLSPMEYERPEPIPADDVPAFLSRRHLLANEGRYGAEREMRSWDEHILQRAVATIRWHRDHPSDCPCCLLAWFGLDPRGPGAEGAVRMFGEPLAPNDTPGPHYSGWPAPHISPTLRARFACTRCDAAYVVRQWDFQAQPGVGGPTRWVDSRQWTWELC